MELLIPIGVVVLATLLLILYFKDSYLEHKICVSKLVYAGTIILIGLLYIIIFYEQIKDDKTYVMIVNIVCFGMYILLSLSYYLLGSKNLMRNYLYKKYLEIVENDKEFVLLDKYDKIKASSEKLEDENKEEVKIIGKNFFSLFDKQYKVLEINGAPLKNKDLHKLFNDLTQETKSKVYKREIKVREKTKEKTELYIVCSDYVICENDKYLGHVLVSEKKKRDTMLHVEEELTDKTKNLDDIKIKFQATLELSQEAIMFNNLSNNVIWANDNLVELLHLRGNSIEIDEFLSLIYKDDLEYYKAVLKNLTLAEPSYETSYRIRVGASYIYVKEKGKRLFDASEDQIMSYLYVVKSNHYERSNIPELDNVKSQAELLAKLDELYKTTRPFQLVTFKINNLPNINDEFGRDMGNMVLAEYIKALNKSFVDDNLIYRTSGLEFTFIIIDYRKMDLLQKALKNDKLLHAQMKYGNNNIQTDVYMGVASSNEVPGKNYLIEATKKSLKTALMPQMRTNYVYYSDIK